MPPRPSSRTSGTDRRAPGARRWSSWKIDATALLDLSPGRNRSAPRRWLASSERTSRRSSSSPAHAARPARCARRRQIQRPGGKARRPGAMRSGVMRSPRHLAMQPGFRQRCSRPTVATEMSSACAVSSTLNPPKNRSSMTFALRSSTGRQSRVSASSSAMMSALFGRKRKRLLERTGAAPAAAFLAAVPAGVIHQDLAHQVRGHAEEVRAALPVGHAPGQPAGRRLRGPAPWAAAWRPRVRRADSARPAGAVRRKRAGPARRWRASCRSSSRSAAR